MPRSKKYYQESSESWKRKYADKQYEAKLLKLKIRDLEASREKWRTDYRTLKGAVKKKEKAAK